MSQLKTLIIPDIHHKILKAQRIIDKFYADVDLIVQLGDVQDSFGDGPAMAWKTATWVKEKLSDPKIVMMMGNHEMSYRYPRISNAQCSGFSNNKEHEINRVLKPEDWIKMPFMYFHNGYYMSHAGMDASWAVHPVNGFSKEYVLSLIEDGIRLLRQGDDPPVFAAGVSRGGYAKVGGLVWNDWKRDFKPIENVNQIVGHTPDRTPRNISVINSDNWCLDCNLDKFEHLNFVGLITDGKFEVVDTKEV